MVMVNLPDNSCVFFPVIHPGRLRIQVALPILLFKQNYNAVLHKKRLQGLQLPRLYDCTTYLLYCSRWRMVNIFYYIFLQTGDALFVHISGNIHAYIGNMPRFVFVAG